MIETFQNHRRLFWLTTAAGIALRLYFVLQPITRVEGDSAVYAELARHMLQLHVYGLLRSGVCVPTMIRLPGYPGFLAACFAVFGIDSYRPILLLQAAFDLGTCFVIADIARRLAGARACRCAYAAAAFCPFTANYAGCLLTETLEIFFTALATLIAIVAFDAFSPGNARAARRSLGLWALCGVALAITILLRPDGGLVLGSIGLVMIWRMFHTRQWRHYLAAGLVVSAVALVPLVPWGIRNYRVFHLVEPLVSLSAIDPGEFEPRGFELWVNTWIIDYSSAEDLTFHIPDNQFDIDVIPSRAFSDDAEREQVAHLADEYNKHYVMNPMLDAEFRIIAERHIREHPWRVRILYPAARLVSMWFRPRTEMLALDTHWWEFEDDPHDSIIAMLLGVLNALYIFAAFAGIIKGRRELRFLGLLVVYPVVRSILLWHMSTIVVEDRYTLECFPMVIVLAGVCLSRMRVGKKKPQELLGPPAAS